MRRSLLVLFVLSLTQITGWGMVSVLPVIATAVATEFRTSLPMVFVGTSVMSVAMGLAALAPKQPVRSRPQIRHSLQAKPISYIIS